MAPELNAPLKSANGSRASRRGKTKTFPKKERQGRACSASRWSAIGGRERAEERFYLTRSGPLMEAATVRSCEKIKTPKNRHFSTARGFVGGAITVSHGASNGFVSPHAERLSISGIISHDLSKRLVCVDARGRGLPLGFDLFHLHGLLDPVVGRVDVFLVVVHVLVEIGAFADQEVH